MLYHIVIDEYFIACRDAVMFAYWPEKEYLKQKSYLPHSWPDSLHDDDRIKKLEELLSGTEDAQGTLVEKISSQPLYGMFKEEAQSPAELLDFPFLRCFHRLFLKRKWKQPYKNPQSQADELFRLNKKAKEDNSGNNYSANIGNYKHFVNVVSALARLIMYFKDVNNLCQIFEEREPKFSHLIYKELPSLRTFKLMLAGFYHDIGKTVTDPRHAVEGAIILGYHTTSARYQIHKIVHAHRSDHSFDREDLMYVAALVLFHDHFGTLGTGEDGYMALVSLIDRIKRYSLKHALDKPEQIKWTRRYLFDLWLLNIADIMVSMNNKWEFQLEWVNIKDSKTRIQEFLTGEGGANRIHDLKIAFDLLDILGAKTHSNDLTALEAEAHACSKRHVIERLRRLMTSALSVPLDDILDSPSQPKNEGEDQWKMIAQEIRNLKKEYWDPIIVRAIMSVSDCDDFITRLSWIGKMDYSLGFFQELAKSALKNILRELKGEIRTGWLRNNSGGISDPDYYAKVQAEFFADNFVSTVIGILAYVLFREPSIDRLRNIEFSDAKSRLTQNKIEQLLAMEGPFRTHRAVEAIMQTIYFY